MLALQSGAKLAAYTKTEIDDLSLNQLTDHEPVQDFLGHKDIKSTVVYTETTAGRRAVR